MSSLVLMPRLSPNEEEVKFVAWTKAAGDPIRRGDVVCVVETTKATFDVTAEGDGYLVLLAKAGDRVSVGAPVGGLADAPGADLSALLQKAPAASASDARWTKKAALVAKRLGIDLEALASASGGRTVTEADVLAAQGRSDTGDLVDVAYPVGRQERVLLLGGAAGAGALALDAIARNPRQRAVAILDGNQAAHGRTVMGVPVLGPLDRVHELWAQGMFDGAIILFTDNIDERASVFESLRQKGIPFTNVLDPTVHRGAHVSLGQGNLIMGNAYLATCVSLGDNNFLASHTCIEHHSRIGSHCTFGPRVTTAGRVTVGDRVKLGMMVAIEPYLTVGSESIVASGCVLTRDIPAQSLVKAHLDYLVRPRGAV